MNPASEREWRARLNFELILIEDGKVPWRLDFFLKYAPHLLSHSAAYDGNTDIRAGEIRIAIGARSAASLFWRRRGTANRLEQRIHCRDAEIVQCAECHVR